MAEVLRVRAVPGVLARDPRVTASHRFIGRGRAPQDGPGLSLGRISATLYDAAKLHNGQPIDIDEQFPMSGPVELSFAVDAKHPHTRLEESKALEKVKQMIAEGAIELAHEEHAQ